MALQLRFTLPEKLYLRDPQETKYGRKLLQKTIDLLSNIGFEAFTFRKLGKEMSSSEVSIYRYFENKHLLLLYLNCWYWEWVHHLIDRSVLNMQDPKAKLDKALHSIIYASKESDLTHYINEQKLHRIVLNESSKSYHIHDVDAENRDGLFLPYKNLVEKLSTIILEVNPKCKYPRSLSSTIFEMTNNQVYYAEHLPRLTDLKGSKNIYADLEKMISFFAYGVINA